ncbi:dihydrodipicolinate synthase family protein [Pelobacter seleniigenes]|uniref:dihydrodipicolinate synthase family protein n=1 Tax=Pelobacter seleniigenes TaxID=407188 RepID=UPI0004A6E9A2|nr:dihydrodipicolinate synthase family protein [Pelobacter seleniigenes]
MELKGIYPIVPTPFLDDGAVDYASIERLIDCMAEKKVHGLAIMGALGEGPKMTDDERTEIIKLYRKRMPAAMHLVVGTRAPATDPAKLQAAKARDLGADALLLGPHGIQKDKPLLEYYQQVSAAAQIPCIIHDYPAVTGITMSVELITQMFASAEYVQYIKLEDPPTGAKMQALQQSVGEPLKVFGALGGNYALEELQLGAVGIMTGFVYAELLVRLYQYAQAGEWEAAKELFYDFLPLTRWEFQPGIGISLRKHLLKRMGVFSTTKVRHPGMNADAKTVEQMLQIVEYLNRKGYELTL